MRGRRRRGYAETFPDIELKIISDLSFSGIGIYNNDTLKDKQAYSLISYSGGQ